MNSNHTRPPLYTLNPTQTKLITILVAKSMRPDLDPAHRVHDTTNRHIRAQTPKGNNRVHSQGHAEVVIAVDGSGACRIHVLPYAEVVVDERVVHPEDRVAGTGRDVGHHGADAVVAVGVRSEFQFCQFGLLVLRGGKGMGVSVPSFGTALHAGVVAS